MITMTKSPTKEKMNKNIIVLINVQYHWLKCSNKTFFNRSADLMLTISLGNTFQSLTVLQK